jgi:hypothetical protein
VSSGRLFNAAVRELLVEQVLPARIERCFEATPDDLKPVAVQLIS